VPWAIYGVFLIGFMYLMPVGVAAAIRIAWARIRLRAANTKHDSG
jgi:branched-chain amino acid transport system permease protein